MVACRLGPLRFMSHRSRADVHVPNESDGLVFASASLRGSGLAPGDRSWAGAVATCQLLPLSVESEDPANVRVVVGDELTAEEQASWVGRVRGGLSLPDGRLALCGGVAYVLEAADWAAEQACVVEVPPGDYAATVLCYASAPNGRRCREAAGSRERLGAWFRRTRPGQAMPAWLHDRCAGDPDEDPGHQRQWRQARERGGGRVVDLLLHLVPTRSPQPVAVAEHGFAEATDCRLPPVFPLGLPVVDLQGLETEEEGGGEDGVDVVASAGSEAPAPAAGLAPQPIPSGPVEVPVVRLARLARLAWLCHPYAQPSLRVTFPGRAPALEDVEGATLRREGPALRVEFDDTGQPQGALEPLLAVASRLEALPDGCLIELDTADPRRAPEPRPVGLHRYRGEVAAGSWRIAEAYPAVDAATLREALALTEALERPRRLLLRDEAEAERVEGRVRQHAPYVLQFPGLQRSGAELLLGKRDPAAFLEVVRRLFWLRYAGTWPLRDEDLASPD